MKPNIFTTLCTVFALLFAVNPAQAHTRWDPNGSLVPRPHSDGSYGDNIKTGPCGNLPRTNKPAEFIAGSTITVQFESTIFHKGFFRIAFSPANDQGFDQNVLKENIQDIQGQRYRSVEITLPNTPCEKCTLQLIQSMLDRTPPSNYFSCADIRLVAPSVPATEPPAPVSEFTAQQEGSDVYLSWKSTNRVLILEGKSSSSGIPETGQQFQVGDSLGAATVVYVGTAQELKLKNRANNTPLWYWAYSVDDNLIYSSTKGSTITLQPITTGRTGGALGYVFLILLFAAGLIRRR